MVVSKKYIAIKLCDSKCFIKAGNIEYLDTLVFHDWGKLLVQVTLTFENYMFKDEIHICIDNDDF